jgi:uncharacterized protein YndB with AHSA1/START domain
MRRMGIALGSLGVGIAAVLAIVAVKPPSITIERSVDIDAPPERVFPLIDDLRRWEEWPTDDPSSRAAKTFGPVASGKGATAEWSGAGSAGAGTMEIAESTPPSRVVVAVDFRRPFAAHNVNDFTLERRGGSTRVTWTWHGQNVLVLKLMSVFTSPDRTMGGHFESGLQALKRRAETP